MIDLEKNCKKFLCGYIFKLQKKSNYNGQIKLDKNTSAIFISNSYYVYINSKKAQLPQLAQLFEKLQKSLDYLSVRGIHNSAVKMPIEHFFFWKFLNHKYSLNLTNRTIIGTHTTIGDISNLEVKEYHEGFRFFRLAQIAHDLYDSYRNLWLSFESLITTCTPRQKGESEYSWYCRALTQFSDICKDHELKELLSKKDIDRLITELYKNIRCSLFHSKHGKSCLIPNKIEDYEEVKKSLRDLTILVLALIKYYYNLQSTSSWTNPDIFIDTYEKHFKGSHMLITDGQNEKEYEKKVLIELLKTTNTHKVSHEVVKKELNVEHKFLSNISIDRLNTTTIRKFSYVKDNQELLILTLEEQLGLKGISNLMVESLFDCKFIEKPRSYDYCI